MGEIQLFWHLMCLHQLEAGDYVIIWYGPYDMAYKLWYNRYEVEITVIKEEFKIVMETMGHTITDEETGPFHFKIRNALTNRPICPKTTLMIRVWSLIPEECFRWKPDCPVKSVSF